MSKSKEVQLDLALPESPLISHNSASCSGQPNQGATVHSLSQKRIDLKRQETEKHVSDILRLVDDFK